MKRNEHKYQAIQKGLHKFFDGKPCKNGHISERYTRNSACVQCAYEDSLTEPFKTKQLEYILSNKDLILKKAKEYRERNKEKLKKAGKEYRIKNSERLSELSRIYSRKNAEKKRKATKLWAEKNKDRARLNGRVSQANRRAKIKNATPAWADMKAIREIYRNCPQGMEVDHVIPLAGKNVCGLHVEYNLQYLPVLVNRIKAASFDDYVPNQGLL